MTSSGMPSPIWSIAEILRSSYKEHEYGDAIMPFVVLRRLDCMLEHTKAEVFAVHKKYEGDTLHDGMCWKASGRAFRNASRFMTLANLMGYVRGFSEDVRDVFDKSEFEVVAQGLGGEDLLFHVISTMVTVDFLPAYIKREMRSCAPNAWLDRSFGKVDYEIPFTRYFYKYEPLRPSSETLAETSELETSIIEKLKKVTER